MSSRPYSLSLDIPTVADQFGQQLTVYHLTSKVVQAYAVPSGEFQIQISVDGFQFQDYGGSFTAPGFLPIEFYAYAVRVKCISAGSATMLLAGLQGE